MAVQEFGKPFPNCGKPSPETKQAIIEMNTKLTSLDEGIAIAKGAVDSATDENVRNQKITDYNALIDVYNSTVPALKALIASYNDSVRAYNTCATLP
jgi:uncharacterized protein YjgD (DUF1641 family)